MDIDGGSHIAWGNLQILWAEEGLTPIVISDSQSRQIATYEERREWDRDGNGAKGHHAWFHNDTNIRGDKTGINQFGLTFDLKTTGQVLLYGGATSRLNRYLNRRRGERGQSLFSLSGIDPTDGSDASDGRQDTRQGSTDVSDRRKRPTEEKVSKSRKGRRIENSAVPQGVIVGKEIVWDKCAEWLGSFVNHDGRNVAVFNLLAGRRKSGIAWKVVNDFRQKAPFVKCIEIIAYRANRLCAEPQDDRDVKSTVKSVSDYVWDHRHETDFGVGATREEQSERSRKGVKKRKKKSDRRARDVNRMDERGGLTNRQIASVIGISTRRVRQLRALNKQDEVDSENFSGGVKEGGNNPIRGKGDEKGGDAGGAGEGIGIQLQELDPDPKIDPTTFRNRSQDRSVYLDAGERECGDRQREAGTGGIRQRNESAPLAHEKKMDDRKRNHLAPLAQSQGSLMIRSQECLKRRTSRLKVRGTSLEVAVKVLTDVEGLDNSQIAELLDVGERSVSRARSRNPNVEIPTYGREIDVAVWALWIRGRRAEEIRDQLSLSKRQVQRARERIRHAEKHAG